VLVERPPQDAAALDSPREGSARPTGGGCRAKEVAGNHAVSLWGRTEAGYATDPIMVERNLIFAATRIQIEMDTYPKWCASGPLASALSRERRAPQLVGDATEAGAQHGR